MSAATFSGSHVLSASKSALILSGCTRWLHPDAKWFSEKTATGRDQGKDIHHCLHLAAMGLPFVASPDIRDRVNHGLVALELMKDKSTLVMAEVAMAYDFRSGKAELLENSENRAYPDDGRFYGTADIITIRKDGALLVADWKTGPVGDGAEEQLKTLAIMAMNLFKTPSGHMRDVYIAPVMLGSDGFSLKERLLSREELAVHQLAIRNRLWANGALGVKASATIGLPVVGPHCTTLYCPHLAHCPATHGELAPLEKAHSDDHVPCQWSEVPESAEHAGNMAARLKAVQRAAKYFEGCLKDWVRLGNKAEWQGYQYAETGRGFLLTRKKE